jgi:hypothetical protein
VASSSHMFTFSSLNELIVFSLIVLGHEYFNFLFEESICHNRASLTALFGLARGVEFLVPQN